MLAAEHRLLLILAIVAATGIAIGDETSGQDSGGPWQRRWETGFLALGGRDTDALLSEQVDDGSGVFGGDLLVDYRVGRVGLDDPTSLYFEVDAGLTGAFRENRGASGADRADFSGRLLLDGDLVRRETGRGLGVALLLQTFDRDLNGESFQSSDYGALAPMITWRSQGRCELWTTVAYLSRESVDDRRSLDDDSQDFSGDQDGYGVEQTFVFGKPDPTIYCERSGPFRRTVRTDVISLFLGVEDRQMTTDGAEFDADYFSAWVGLDVPFGDDRRWTLGLRARRVAGDFDNASVRGGDDPREETTYATRLDVRHHLVGLFYPPGKSYSGFWKHFDLRFSIERAERHANLDFYDLDRTRVTLALEGRLGGWRFDRDHDDTGTDKPPKVGTGGTRVEPVAGGPGGDPPAGTQSGG